MLKKINFLIISITLLSLTIAHDCQAGGGSGACTEAGIVSEARTALANLACSQVYYSATHSGQTYPYCPGSVCWNSSSIIGSTNDLNMTLDSSLGINMSGKSGDVRFRCAYMMNKLFCFAFRCLEAEPSGCKQWGWRIRSEPNCSSGNRCSPPTDVKIFDNLNITGCPGVEIQPTICE